MGLTVLENQSEKDPRAPAPLWREDFVLDEVNKGHVLHLNNYMMVGGAEYYTLHLMAVLPEYRHTMIVRLETSVNAMLHNFMALGVNPQFLHGRVKFQADMIRDIDPDVVIWHGGCEEGDCFKEDFTNTMFVKVHHGNNPVKHDGFHKHVCVSTTAKERERDADFQRTAVVIPSCVDTARYEGWDADPERPFTLGRYGSDRFNKFPEDLPEILTEATDEDSRIIMVGGTMLKKKFVNLGSLSRVEWVPADPFKKYDYLKRMDAAIYKNTKGVIEGCSVAITELMATGVPIVAEARGGNTEQIVDGLTGVLIDWEDKQGFIDAIRWMKDHPAERRAMGQAAKKRAQKLYSLDRFREQWKNLIEAQ